MLLFPPLTVSQVAAQLTVPDPLEDIEDVLTHETPIAPLMYLVTAEGVEQ